VGSKTPLNREWFEENERELAEEPIDTAAVASVEEEIRRLYDEERMVWKSPAWEHIDAYLAKEFARESEVLFATDDREQLILARERARVISRLRKKPTEVSKELQSLSKRRLILIGEVSEEE
jgi:hypothetical protein